MVLPPRRSGGDAPCCGIWALPACKCTASSSIEAMAEGGGREWHIATCVTHGESMLGTLPRASVQYVSPFLCTAGSSGWRL